MCFHMQDMAPRYVAGKKFGRSTYHSDFDGTKVHIYQTSSVCHIIEGKNCVCSHMSSGLVEWQKKVKRLVEDKRQPSIRRIHTLS